MTATSLRKQIRLIQGRHIHLDIIYVAFEQITKPLQEDFDHAVFLARETYAQVDLGIARVKFFGIPEAEANGYDAITKKREARKLTKEFSGPNGDAIDVFVVPNYAVTTGGEGKVGLCRIGLPKNKNLYVMSGCVMGARWFGIGIGHVMAGQVIAHEVGHGLKLKHSSTVGNLMFPTATGTALTASQGETMRDHRTVQDGCGG